MARSLQERLRAWADEMDAEDRADLEAAERQKMDELAAQPRLSEDEVEWLRKLRAGLAKDDDGPIGEQERAEKEKPEPKPKREEKPEPKLRPGRKSGMAYAWYVADDGQVVNLAGQPARIYSGPDEPDEVEIPEPVAPEPEGDEEADAA